MMGGNIDIKSRLGEGTTVQISLPLMRPPAGSESTLSTPHSASTSSTRDDSFQMLRDEAAGYSVCIREHHGNYQLPTSSREYAKVLASYVRDWCGLKMCDWADRGKASVLVIEERDIPEVLNDGRMAGSEGNPALVVLCSNATRHSEAEADRSESHLNGVFEYISKPCGPYKLARALRVCLGRTQLLNSTHVPRTEASVTFDEKAGFKELDLPALPGEKLSITVQANGTTSVSQVTRNAQMAINNRATGGEHRGHEFPFPAERSCSATSPLSPEVQDLSKWTDRTPQTSSPPNQGDRAPRILLVDDNKINLQLLQTFVHKRKYSVVDSAEDGNVAVNAVKAAKTPYDIIFMGKS
jgi:DNA-binding response OmpR family regulator